MLIKFHRLRDAFIAFAESDSLGVELTDQYTYLSSRPQPEVQIKVTAKKPLSRTFSLKTAGFFYIMFPLPAEGDVSQIKDPFPGGGPELRINEDLITHGTNGSRFIQLGTASLLNVRQHISPMLN